MALNARRPFNGHMASTPQEITDGWAEHFETLYSSSDDPRFDDEHKNHISRQLQIINENLAFSEPPTISTEEIEAAVRLGKKGKAAGDDGITYEHIVPSRYFCSGSFCFMSWCLKFFVLLAPYVCFHIFS